MQQERSDQVGNVLVNLSSQDTVTSGGFTVNPGKVIDGYASVDTLISIEHVRTGSGNDVVLGSANAERIVTNAGNDSVNAGDGADTVLSGDGLDVVWGGAAGCMPVMIGWSAVTGTIGPSAPDRIEKSMIGSVVEMAIALKCAWIPACIGLL